MFHDCRKYYIIEHSPTKQNERAIHYGFIGSHLIAEWSAQPFIVQEQDIFKKSIDWNILNELYIDYSTASWFGVRSKSTTLPFDFYLTSILDHIFTTIEIFIMFLFHAFH